MLLLTVGEMLTAAYLQFTIHIHFGFIDRDDCKMHCCKKPDYSVHINHRSRVLFI